MLKKFKEWIGTNLDVYKVENANDIAPGLVRHIWKGEETATQIGTTLKAQIMNDLQKGLVHTLNATRTAGTNKDIYEVVLNGIEEFGVFDGLKLLIRINGENRYDDVFLKLGGVEYPIYRIKENSVEKLNKGTLKEKREYLLNYSNNSFVLSGDALYGTETGTSLEGNRLAEILGLQFGGNIQDIGNKTKGKFYYDSVTKFYYECIEDNSLTYNDSGKFRAISNKPISDKLEKLFKNANGGFNFANLIFKSGNGRYHKSDLERGTRMLFGTPFDNSCLFVVAQDNNVGAHSVAVLSFDREGFKVIGRDNSSQLADTDVNWFAVGY